jgi:TRAP-type transport system small permease protein
MRHIINWMVQWAAFIAGLCMFLMMVIGTIDVIGSKLFNAPLPGAYELTETLMVGAIFLAIALTQSKRLHIVVDLFTSHLTPTTRIKFDAFSYLCSFLFFFIIAWQGWVFGIKSLQILEYESGIIPFPVYPSKLALAVGATITCLQCLVDLIEASTKSIRKYP